ncbi:MAG TPA: prepilin-type N-terminal cleavage/methylation domain-containing protein, partial [Patescibacteria group bacterium]
MQTNIKNKRACPHRRTYLLCNAKRCRRGFSLMELLVVVAIIFIMTGVLVVQQNGKSKNKAN